jgi:predicted phosphoadenosine phosphosulfate sulfurtransferase
MKDKIERYIRTWVGRGYPEGIPDEADPVLESLNKAPSYRLICKAILTNDHALKSLGFSRPECAAYNTLKQIELRERGTATYPQLELFF